jgi:hypothetical protein
MKRKSTAAQRRTQFKKKTRPTIGVGEDQIRGRGDGGRIPELRKGELGENIAQSSRDADAIGNIDQSQAIEGGGDDFDGESPLD